MIKDRKLSKEIANEIYTILVEVCGAPDPTRITKSGEEYNPYRYEFVYEFSEKEEPTREWRFCGNLGFGGKFWHNNDKFYVSCYREDETPEREKAICEANDKLIEIYNKAYERGN